MRDADLKSTRLILLTSSGQRGDGKVFADIGFAGYLLKPVTQRDLTGCLMRVLAESAEIGHSKTQPLITRQRLSAQRVRAGNRILLAEDNVVNQKVAMRLLEKLGYCVDVVGNGRAAVDAWRVSGYDLILMDCQMPELDGYEATREIRRLEGAGRHVPIIALTAHAMKGVEQECIETGMDGYLSKPIDRAKLEACLERHLSLPPQEAAESAAPMSAADDAPSPTPVDWNSLLVLAGDEGFARELAAEFLESGLSGLEAIGKALASGDIGALGNKAHELRGASLSMHAGAMTTAAKSLEAAARAGHREQLPALAQGLRREFDCAAEFLRSKVA
jgi:CheY-like chemotaxis protein/HPt (histidine-containing phosphotransfer) domain-containing protein